MTLPPNSDAVDDDSDVWCIDVDSGKSDNDSSKGGEDWQDIGVVFGSNITSVYNNKNNKQKLTFFCQNLLHFTKLFLLLEIDMKKKSNDHTKL